MLRRLRKNKASRSIRIMWRKNEIAAFNDVFLDCRFVNLWNSTNNETRYFNLAPGGIIAIRVA